MTHGEWFGLFLLMWMCMASAREMGFGTFLGRIILVCAIIYNLVLWIIDTAHPAINLG